MADKNTVLAQELGKFYEAAWLDLPAAAARQMFGGDSRDELREAGWKAYDAWIGLANEFANQVYSNPAIGEMTGRVMESGLRLRHIGGAITTAVFANLWPAVGLPTRTELTALRDELSELREVLSAYASESKRLPASRPESAAHPADGGLRLIRRGIESNGYRMNGDAGSYRAVKEGKSGVAA